MSGNFPIQVRLKKPDRVVQLVCDPAEAGRRLARLRHLLPFGNRPHHKRGQRKQNRDAHFHRSDTRKNSLPYFTSM
jgi:hypothetical protein